MGMSPHSSSTFFLQFRTAKRESLSVVEKSYDTCLSSTVIGFGDCIKLLLAGSVPQHQPHFLPVNSQLLLQEVHSNCLLITFSESPATVALDHARFSNCTIPDNPNLDRNLDIFISQVSDIHLENTNLSASYF